MSLKPNNVLPDSRIVVSLDFVGWQPPVSILFSHREGFLPVQVFAAPMPEMPWSCLAPPPKHPSPSLLAHDGNASANSAGPSAVLESKQRVSYAQAMKGKICDISPSQLPKPCVKGDQVSVKIPEADYRIGLEKCRNNLHGRLILMKGDMAIKIQDLRSKLSMIWKPVGKWGIISLGKGFYEFTFSNVDDLRRIRTTPTWSLKPDRQDE